MSSSSIVKKVIAKDGSFRALAVSCPELLNEAQKVHEASPLAILALGRAMIGASLLSGFYKEARTGLLFKGDGPLGQVFAEGDTLGNVRGYVENSQYISDSGKLKVGEGIGKGIVTITSVASNKELPYSGHVEIQTGEIGEDLAYYLFQSQQIPSIVALSVLVQPDGKISHAGGIMIQALPNASEKVISQLEKNVKSVGSVSEILKRSVGASGLFAEFLKDFELVVLDDGPELKYNCSCNIDKVTDALLMTGPDEIKALIKKRESASVQCGFCGRKYGVPVSRLKSLLIEAEKKS